MSPKRIFLSPPHMGGKEVKWLREAFKSNYIAPCGPQIDALEKAFSAYTGIAHCVALSSGTAAIHLALRHLDIGPGDEVFASTLTFIGSVSPIIFLGAKPVFIDSNRESWNMDPDLLLEALEDCNKKAKLPKAVITTDLYGQCSDYDRINAICAQFDIPLIVDAAEAMGATYHHLPEDKKTASEDLSEINEKNKKWLEHRLNFAPHRQHAVQRHAGKGAKAAVFSFNGNKIMTTSGGGMLASDDRDLIAHAQFLSRQACDPLPHYEHSEIGYNYRMSNILAAIGLGQLEVLDQRVARKREIFSYYAKALKDLPGIELMPEAPFNQCNRWLTVVLIDPDVFGSNRENIRLALENENIESRPVWKPMHLQPVFDIGDGRAAGGIKKRYAARVVGGKVAEELFARGLCLPSGTAMRSCDLDRTVSVLRRCNSAPCR
jgi:dTDP-4-amino-4,6-dideoxygalactose transaminase